MFVFQTRDIQERHLPLVQPLTVEEKIRRLMNVEDDAVRERRAGRLYEVEPDETEDCVAGAHERGRDERLDALRRQPFTGAGIDGVDVREQEVAPREDAGVELDEIRQVARLLSTNLWLDAVGAPLVRIRAHGGLAGLPEPIDVATIRPHAPADRSEDEIRGVFVRRSLNDMPHKRTEQHPIFADVFLNLALFSFSHTYTLGGG